MSRELWQTVRKSQNKEHQVVDLRMFGSEIGRSTFLSCLAYLVCPLSGKEFVNNQERKN